MIRSARTSATKDEQLKRIAEGAKIYGSVEFVSPDGKRAVVRTGNQLTEVLAPSWKITAGDPVTLHPMTGQIIDTGIFVPQGAIARVTKVIGDGMYEIEGHTGPAVAMCGKDLNLEEGCRVSLNGSGTVIVANLGKPASEYERGETSVSWDDIGGLVEAKAMMIEAIETPHRFPDMYKHYGQKPPKGILLRGPPGCGKTMLGKAGATAIAHLHEADISKGLGSGFMYIKGPEVLSKWVGNAEAAIREIFARVPRALQVTRLPGDHLSGRGGVPAQQARIGGQLRHGEDHRADVPRRDGRSRRRDLDGHPGHEPRRPSRPRDRTRRPRGLGRCR